MFKERRWYYKTFISGYAEVPEIETDNFQGAIDEWSYHVSLGRPAVIRVEGDNLDRIMNSQGSIKEWADYLIKNKEDQNYYNRVEKAIMEYNRENKTDETVCLSEEVDFHGKFEEMTSEEQDAIINPQHYKMVPKEAYARFPEGLEYMDLMEYILKHHKGVGAHLLGQVFKYGCRLGKKDAALQDAKKIAWYANRLVEVLSEK